MKSLIRWLGLAGIYLIGIGISLITSVNVFNGSSSLDTRKIDQNIERLKKLDWFNALYESERHHRSFFVSLQIRKYLHSSFRVHLLERSERAQKNFIKQIEKVAEARERNND